MGLANLAYVYDNSFFGWTAPVLGQRYRVEAGSYFGSLDMYTALLDYRRYFMPVRPFTLAFRLMHYGRYGSDADNFNQLSPLFIGYDGLVRGYEYGSFDLFDPEEADAYFRLFGSRFVIGNAELRFPPLAFLGNSGLFGFLPIDAHIFADAGIAWQGDDPASGLSLYGLFGGARDPLYSAGAGLRMNVFGVIIIELDYVYPFNRGRGGHFQFGFTPGF
jgi:outer membrane protein assembly factor BamA